MYSKTLLVLHIVYLLSDGSHGQTSKKFFRNDYNYIAAVESFYKIHTTPQTWPEAKRVCALEEAALWHPDNYDEAHAVTTFWKNATPNIEWVYVGLSDRLAEGIFETVDGKPISEVYSNWQRYQPDDSNGSQNCVAMDAIPTMNDYMCNVKSYFICKKSLKTLEWNYHCNMPYLDYIFNENNGKCYKLHTTPLNWSEAYAVCRLEQSSLAMINNQLEADYLANLTEFTPKPSVKGKYQRGLYHLGYYNRFNDGWTTIEGKPIDLDANAWFDNCQPGNEHEECGAMFYTGRLINTDCDMKSFFICEHEPNNLNSSSILEDIL